MIKEFKEFILRGNVIDLAVGVVIGSAFTAIVTSLVEGLLTPLITLVFSLFGSEDTFSGLVWEPKKNVVFNFGQVITAIITFLITAFVLFLIVKAVNKLRNLHQKPVEEEPEITAEDYLQEIRDLLKVQTEARTNITTNDVNRDPFN
ncbi:large conductance mechanosensitive channel protein MscL [Enterococcus sp.]|uniref:large conductance mechanosensitive channel protein MscL n=1 Tax=Enterococcus sp. TaxID=35783 RepID=UPI0025B97891|nr:large conductance mechanosensitive channel protein MscL [Enterococcus sp.]